MKGSEERYGDKVTEVGISNGFTLSSLYIHLVSTKLLKIDSFVYQHNQHLWDAR
jgi:hypothetical protein